MICGSRRWRKTRQLFMLPTARILQNQAFIVSHSRSFQLSGGSNKAIVRDILRGRRQILELPCEGIVCGHSRKLSIFMDSPKLLTSLSILTFRDSRSILFPFNNKRSQQFLHTYFVCYIQYIFFLRVQIKVSLFILGIFESQTIIFDTKIIIHKFICLYTELLTNFCHIFYNFTQFKRNQQDPQSFTTLQ